MAQDESQTFSEPNPPSRDRQSADRLRDRHNFDVGESLHEWAELQSETESLRLDLISTGLDLCLTFDNLADTKFGLGHREQAQRTLGTAEKGYSDLLRLFSQAKNPPLETAERLAVGFRHPRERLDGLQRVKQS